MCIGLHAGFSADSLSPLFLFALLEIRWRKVFHIRSCITVYVLRFDIRTVGVDMCLIRASRVMELDFLGPEIGFARTPNISAVTFS